MRWIFLCLLCVPVLLTISIGNLWADSYWNIASVSTDEWMPDNITFRFDGNNLFLNNTSIYHPGNSSGYREEIHLSGQWAVCGTISDGQLVADPCATFVPGEFSIPQYEYKWEDGIGCVPYVDVWTKVGHISWLSTTPLGYSASLQLGADFTKNGASTFTNTLVYANDPPKISTGTIVLETYWNFAMGEECVSDYESRSNVFQIEYVPEPSSITAFLCSLAGFIYWQRRN